jgi:hypothetical protein
MSDSGTTTVNFGSSKVSAAPRRDSVERSLLHVRFDPVHAFHQLEFELRRAPLNLLDVIGQVWNFHRHCLEPI